MYVYEYITYVYKFIYIYIYEYMCIYKTHALNWDLIHIIFEQ